MKIESNGDEKITVALSCKDMNDLDITYEDMDYSNIETRRVIWTILDRAKHDLGKPFDTDGRLLIEVAPDGNGGCVMFFTTMPCDSKSKKRLIMKKDAEPLIFCAFDCDSFLDALEMLKNKPYDLKGFESYKYDNRLYIVIFPKITKSSALSYSLCEFGDIDIAEKRELGCVFENGIKLS